jgi:hypothetical protein
MEGPEKGVESPAGSGAGTTVEGGFDADQFTNGAGFRRAGE